VTLPQTPAAIKAILAIATLVLATAATPAARAEEQRQTLFSCGTDSAEDDGFLDLSGTPDDPDTWVGLRFERTANGNGELIYSFPPQGTDYRTSFRFSHSNGPEGYLVSVRWHDRDLSYVYYSLDIPPDPGIEDDVGGGDAGLVISKDGTLVERISCVERPYMFISYMRDAMSCDEANPYGPAACSEDGAERTVPLDVDAIGIVD
jgi:hypothetical protein